MPEPLAALLADPPSAPTVPELGPLVRRRVRRRRATLGGGAGVVALGLAGIAVVALPGGGRPAPAVLAATPAAAVSATPAATSPSPSTSPTPTPTWSDAEIVAEFLPATGPETQPGRFTRLGDRVRDAAVDACDRAAGLPVRPATRESSVHDNEMPDLPLIARVGLSESLAGPPPGTRPRACLDASSAALAAVDEVEASVASPLREAWEKVVVATDADPRVVAARAGLGACLAAHGVAAATEDGFYGYVDSRLMRVPAASFQAENVRLGGIFAACMAPVEGRRDQLRLAARPAFLAAHAAQVAELEERARAAVAEVAATTGLTLDPS